jgi:transposase
MSARTPTATARGRGKQSKPLRAEGAHEKRRAMEHVAIDLCGRESRVCVRAADGTILDEKTWPTRELRGYLRSRPVSRVIMELCAGAFGVASVATALGHEARIVPATLLRSLGVGSRGRKSTGRDAQILSEVSCRIDLPSVPMATADLRMRKTMCGMREALVESRAKLIRSVRAWMRGDGLAMRACTPDRLPERVRAVAGKAIPPYVKRLLGMIETLTKQITASDVELRKLARCDSTCARLMSVPGVGPVTAIRFAAALDSIEHFPSAQKVESFLGLKKQHATQ